MSSCFFFVCGSVELSSDTFCYVNVNIFFFNDKFGSL